MKKNKPPLTAPAVVNVQRRSAPSGLSDGGKRGPPCHELHVDLPFPAVAQWGRVGPGKKGGGAYYMCVSLTQAGQMGPTRVVLRVHY